ncbi:LPP20 family lipoprotein [Pseudoalteromonas sp. T1lg23B]|uniref:LPP20 family lipoprotein n=1 Tax=Pseudoalteromonas sp. T1lg23B TaxID=2077097 RepID=UPI000CF628AA|nr:LPP20 family lipoprotein [Pseudoalteromonas sp. T1lg23B]
MVSKLTGILCIGALLLSGCQSTAQTPTTATKPAWLTTTPSSDYLIYGVGYADSVGDMQNAKLAAQESARLALAKQLNVTISAHTTVSQSATEKSMQYHVDELISSQVPNILLQGVKIEDEFWQNNTAYALASFNRTEAIMQTELSINAVDEEIMQISLSDNSKSQRLKQAISVRTLAIKRQKLNDYLQMLQSPKLPLPTDVLSKLSRSAQVLNTLSFSIVADSSEHENIRDLMASSLTSNGIQISQSDADFELAFRVNWQQIVKSGTHYSIAESFMVVKEQGMEKAHFNDKVKAASSYAQTARNNAMQKLADKLSEQLAHFIVYGGI